MSGSAIGDLREKIGRILGSIEGLTNVINDQRAERLRQEGRISSDIQALRDDRHQVDTAISLRIEALNRQVTTVISEVGTLKDDVAELKDETGKLKITVESLADLRRRVVAYVMISFSIMGVIWTLVGPVIQGLIVELWKPHH